MISQCLHIHTSGNVCIFVVHCYLDVQQSSQMGIAGEKIIISFHYEDVYLYFYFYCYYYSELKKTSSTIWF